MKLKKTLKHYPKTGKGWNNIDRKNKIIRWVKYVLPFGLVELLSRKRRGGEELISTPSASRTSVNALLRKDVYCTDLTDLERWGLLAVLCDLETRRTQVRYLEIGVFGGGTINFLREYTHKTKFSGIDLFEDFELQDDNTHVSGTFRLQDIQKAIGDSVELIKGHSARILPKLSKLRRSFDMIFIDGNHTYNATKSDFECCGPLLEGGGFIAFHNCSVGIAPDYRYVCRDGGPWRVTQEIRKMPNFCLEVEVDRLRVFSYSA